MLKILNKVLKMKKVLIKLVLIFGLIPERWVVNASILKDMSRRTCVVGAGVAGLSAARHLADAGEQFTVLEATAYVGGTWRYDPHVGTDEHGQPVHTSMYKHLRTNLPKQTMEFPGYPMPADTPSFPSWKLYYEYLKSYADYFELKKYIKFLHEVTLITRVGDHWKMRYRSVISGEEYEENCDYVIIGNGHHSKPRMPNIPGEDKFKGTIIHSHDYREPSPYRGRRVLVLGAGPSAMDIGLVLADTCSRLVHSHHSPVKFHTPFPATYLAKPDVAEFTERGVLFKDGSYEEIDDVIYCTGFEYSYPFLDDTSGIELRSGAVTPLYRHMVNIRQPTMLLIGLVVRGCIVVAIDAQAQYAAALVSGRFALPPEDEMMSDWQSRVDELRASGRRLTDLHLLWHNEDQYYANLTAEAGISRVPPVLVAIRKTDTLDKLENLYTYRNYVYTVLDEYNFTREYCAPPGPGDHVETHAHT